MVLREEFFQNLCLVQNFYLSIETFLPAIETFSSSGEYYISHLEGG